MSTPDKRDPARGWQFIERLLADEHPERLDKATDEEVVRQMEAQGVPEPSRVPSAEEWLAKAAKRAAQREASGAKVKALRVRTKRVPWVAWLAAAAVGGLVVVAVVWPGQHDVASGWPDGGAERMQQAAKLREEAFAACGAGQWRACEDRLLEAKRLDPEGDEEGRVKAAYKAALQGLHTEGGSPGPK